MELSSRILKLLAVLFPIVAYSAIFISIAFAPWFSWYENALSDLGAYHATALIFNGGLIVSGFIYAIYSLGLLSYFRHLMGKIGAMILLIDAISLSLVGVFPETVGRLHGLFAVLYFILFPVAFLFLGTFFLKHESNLKYCLISYLFSIIGLGVWFLPWRTWGISGIAIPEFIASLANTIYIIAITLKLD
ncbi:MAG: DUF998 domain-containing protein [Candidatus Njordarchaeota archaeon]